MSIDSFNDTARNYLSFLNNDYIKTGLSLFLLLYASLAAPQLPNYIAKLFDYTLFKLFIFFLIIYVSKHDPTIAIIAAIAVMVSLLTLNRYKFNQEMMTVLEREDEIYKKYTPSGINCTCTCSKNNQESETYSEHDYQSEQEQQNNFNDINFFDMNNPIKYDELRKLENELLQGNMIESKLQQPASLENLPMDIDIDEPIDLDMKSIKKISYISGAPIDNPFDISYELHNNSSYDPSIIPIDICDNKGSDMMDEKIALVLEEISKYEKNTGKKITPDQIKNLCSCINDEYCLSKPSLMDLQESHQQKLTKENTIPNGMYSDTGNYEFASVNNLN